MEDRKEQLKQNDEPLGVPGVPPSEFHPHRPDAPFKKKGNVRLAIIVAILIVVIDLCIYFFLLKPTDSELLKAIEPLKPVETTTNQTVAPSTAIITQPATPTSQTLPDRPLTSSPVEEGVMCTMDAKQCSDGSFVGRSGPNCEFVCPDGTKSK